MMSLPDYRGGSIVNLMASLVQARGGDPGIYPPLRELDPQALAGRRHIVLLVIDGLGHRQLLRSAAGATLRARLAGVMTSVFPTTTASAVTSFLTGVAPQQHGLTGWHMWFRELGSVLAVLPGRPRFGGVSLGDCGIDLGRLLGHVPVFDRLATPCVSVAPAHIAHSDFNRAHQGRARVISHDSLATLNDAIVRAVTETRGPAFTYAYWPQLDSLAHQHGVASEAVAGHLAEIDAAFAELQTRLAGSDTLLIVTADHGIIDTAPAQDVLLDDHPVLADCLALPLCGERRASYCYVRPGRRDTFEDYCRDVLAPCAELYPSHELIEGGWFGLGEPHPRLAERVGDYTLLMRDNHVITDRLFGERPFRQVGVHGGLSEDELYVPLVLAAC